MKKKIETASGFKCTIDTDTLDDMYLVELIAKVDDNVLLLPELLDRLMGAETKNKLYKHLENKEGRVPSESLQAELAEIMEQMGDTDEGKK